MIHTDGDMLGRIWKKVRVGMIPEVPVKRKEIGIMLYLPAVRIFFQPSLANFLH